MVRWLLFAHVAGVVFWLGGIAALLVLQRQNRRLAEGEAVADDGAQRLVLRTIGTVVRWILTPSAAIVLLSGPIMLMQMGLIGMDKPFWLEFMERSGGVVSLVSIGLLTWQLRKAERATSGPEQARYLHTLGYGLSGVGVATLATIFVVMLRM